MTKRLALTIHGPRYTGAIHHVSYGLGHAALVEIESLDYVYDGPDDVDLAGIQECSCVNDIEEFLLERGFVKVPAAYEEFDLVEMASGANEEPEPFKTVIIQSNISGEWKEYEIEPGQPHCGGCPELCIARGWECYYERDTQECKYPDQMLRKWLAENDD